MKKTVLMVGFHFPPSALSSGHLRLTGFVKYLPAFGWEPVVLTANERAYHSRDSSRANAAIGGSKVYRAFALDTKRHLGILGKYPSILAQPDRWMSWWPAAVVLGLRLIRRHRVRVIWSTYPIMTAHCIAHTLSRISGLPWVADFRDPVVVAVASQNQLTVSNQLRWEGRILTRAKYSVFTTHGASSACAKRYPEAESEHRLVVIPNGYDEEDFRALLPSFSSPNHKPLHFVHSGFLYPCGRNPVPFFTALARLIVSQVVKAGDILVTLRSSGSESLYTNELKRLGLDSIITLAPPLPYREALAEQAGADALLLFQGEQYDQQIPTKLYEYLRVDRPIFALLGERGETARVLRNTGGAIVAPLDDVEKIAQQLTAFIDAVRQSKFRGADKLIVQRYSRQYASEMLARLFEGITTNEALAK